ncbi:MAG: aminotransferase class V-fold PLP-dependent enzyme [Actinomycetota bacterium]
MRQTYLDHAATTPMRPEAIDAVGDAQRTPHGNPTGAHGTARLARRWLEEARESVAALVGRDPVEVCFTSGGTEADDLAVSGFAERGAIVCGATEHHAVLYPVERAGGRVVGVHRDGGIDLDALADALDPTVALVSVMLANNETGRVIDLDEIAAVVREHAPDAKLHTDAVQAGAWLDLGTAAAAADLLSLSAHKLGGPMGIGVLVARRDAEPPPRVLGGGQERGRRAGTQNVAGAVGFAAAADALNDDRSAMAERVRSLRDRMEDELIAAIDGATPTVPREHRLPGTCHLVIDDVAAESMIVLLDEAGIATSAASSCASGAAGASHVLSAMGSDLGAASTVRLSLGWCSEASDVDRVLDVLPDVVRGLRSRRAAVAGS